MIRESNEFREIQLFG